MVHPELIEILVCPETHQPVRLIQGGELERVNRGILTGHLKNRRGEVVMEPLQTALIREDGLLLYPVRDDIPVMLIDESVPLDLLP
jgi:uncharacterized protein YbaR (Trm112 family)